MQRYPHCVVMEHDELGVIIVPDLSLRALNQISITEIVKAILDANTDIQGLHLYMCPLCEAIIRRVYHFEDATSQQSKLGARGLGRPRSRATSQACKANSLQLTKLATSASTNARNRTTALHNTDARSLLSEMSQVVEDAGSSTGDSVPRTSQSLLSEMSQVVEDAGSSTGDSVPRTSQSLLSEMSQVVENAGSSTGASLPRTLSLYYLKCRKSFGMQILRRGS